MLFILKCVLEWIIVLQRRFNVAAFGRTRRCSFRYTIAIICGITLVQLAVYMCMIYCGGVWTHFAVIVVINPVFGHMLGEVFRPWGELYLSMAIPRLCDDQPLGSTSILIARYHTAVLRAVRDIVQLSYDFFLAKHNKQQREEREAWIQHTLQAPLRIPELSTLVSQYDQS